MINYHTTLVSKLKTILPTHYELFVDSSTTTPCITYYEDNNADVASGDSISYGVLSYIIKVWSNKVDELQIYSLQVDSVMRGLGFKRMSSQELFDPNSTMGEKILRYETNTTENY